MIGIVMRTEEDLNRLLVFWLEIACLQFHTGDGSGGSGSSGSNGGNGTGDESSGSGGSGGNGTGGEGGGSGNNGTEGEGSGSGSNGTGGEGSDSGGNDTGGEGSGGTGENGGNDTGDGSGGNGTEGNGNEDVVTWQVKLYIDGANIASRSANIRIYVVRDTGTVTERHFEIRDSRYLLGDSGYVEVLSVAFDRYSLTKVWRWWYYDYETGDLVFEDIAITVPPFNGLSPDVDHWVDEQVHRA